MKRLLLILILTINFQSWTKADDIKDFEIDGMSIGDSALKYYSESQIKSQKKNWYKGKKYSTSTINDIQISYKTKDSEYILASLDKVELMDISKCSKEITLVVDNISALFSDKVKLKGPERTKHWADKSKKSWYDTYTFIFPNKDYIFVECYDWSKNVSWEDHLRVRIVSKEFLSFLNKE
tara:strand:- start:80 stop:619 length:540 start_codon:yes stop_codon:yes gene_type:complete